MKRGKIRLRNATSEGVMMPDDIDEKSGKPVSAAGVGGRDSQTIVSWLLVFGT